MADDKITQEVRMTTAMLKAMANPIRRDALRALSRRRFARAADLAQDLGIPANKISFHLRVLAGAGLIEEAPDHARDRRDRVWTPVSNTLTLGDPEHPVEDEALGAAVLASVVEDHHDLLRRVLGWAPEYISGREKSIHGTLAHATVNLTEQQFVEVLDQIQTILSEASTTETSPDHRTWQIAVLAADDQI